MKGIRLYIKYWFVVLPQKKNPPENGNIMEKKWNVESVYKLDITKSNNIVKYSADMYF